MMLQYNQVAVCVVLISSLILNKYFIVERITLSKYKTLLSTICELISNREPIFFHVDVGVPCLAVSSMRIDRL